MLEEALIASSITGRLTPALAARRLRTRLSINRLFVFVIISCCDKGLSFVLCLETLVLVLSTSSGLMVVGGGGRRIYKDKKSGHFKTYVFFKYKKVVPISC